MLSNEVVVGVLLTILAWHGAQAGCGTISNVDFPSQAGILNNGNNDLAFTNEDCCEKCANHPSCKVWTRIKGTPEVLPAAFRNSGDSSIGECWLRSFRPAQKECDYCDSGVNSCQVLGNTDFPSKNGVLNNGELTKSNAECCRKCNARTDCKAWTRIKKDTKQNKAGECWLRSFVPNRKFCAECDSGSKE
ncbi:hypothetical protein BSKO_05128 [Bryopsis sp. KO-2023]|nr:hypothetical protein BSKO_05128 [Bryopsis sp. KO-2023]